MSNNDILKFSHLTKDILATIHERRNLFAPINRLSPDVLVLIPLHLSSLSDRFRVTFVCRRWRRTFLRYAPIWSQLHLAGTTDPYLIGTLLERVRGAPVDVTIEHFPLPFQNVAVLSPLAQQIRSLKSCGGWSDRVQDLSVAISGPLPLLHTLEITANWAMNEPRPSVAPTLPLFKDAVNLKKFSLSISDFPSLYHFTFPSLTTFDFSTWTLTFSVSELLNFLEASPSLRWINMTIAPFEVNEDVPPGRVAVLPHVETFSLQTTCEDPGCEIITHMSCPYATLAEFSHCVEAAGYHVPEVIYPPPGPLGAIVRQYTKGIVDQVIFELSLDEHLNINSSLTFLTPDRVTLELSYTHFSTEDEGEMGATHNERFPEIFSQASRTIGSHPQLENVRHLSIRGGSQLTGNLELTTSDVGKLLGSMGPLERLILVGCDLRPFLDAFLDTPLFPDAIQPASFPLIKKLTITDPIQSLRDGVFAAAIVGLAKSQHARGTPLERVAFGVGVPLSVVQELLPFVTVSVEYYDDGDGDASED